MTKWEYQVERFDQMHNGSYYTLQNILNERGSDGWELLDAQMLPSGGGQSADLPFAIFKRPTQ